MRLSALVRRIGVVAEDGANAASFVRGTGGADTAPTEEHGALHAFAENRRGHCFCEVRIVNWGRIASSQVFHGVAQAAQIREYRSLKRKSGVVGSDGDMHYHFPCASCALAASTTAPVVNPNSFCSTFNVAAAPNVL